MGNEPTEYKMRNRGIAVVEHIDDCSEFAWPITGRIGPSRKTWTIDGFYIKRNHPHQFDLIDLVNKNTLPEPFTEIALLKSKLEDALFELGDFAAKVGSHVAGGNPDELARNLGILIQDLKAEKEKLQVELADFRKGLLEEVNLKCDAQFAAIDERKKALDQRKDLLDISVSWAAVNAAQSSYKGDPGYGLTDPDMKNAIKIALRFMAKERV